MGITTDPHLYDKKLSDGSFDVEVYKVDTWKYDTKIRKGVVLSGYDENIISVDGTKVTPKSAGETFVTATWKNHSTVFIIRIK